MGYLANALGDANNLGFFATPTDLTNAYPVGAPGYFAVVGSTGTIWVWDPGTSAWVDSGAPGSSAFVYIAYASDDIGTNFTNTFDPTLDYIAVKSTTVAIPTPVAADFAGLWKNYKGAMTWKGNYDGGTAYKVNDSVYYLGSSYICILASTGNLPTNGTYWNLVAQKGADGAGSGDVNGPATNTDSYIPQWNGANSKTLKDGLAVPAGGLAGITALNLKQDKFTCVAKTIDYTANPWDLVNCDVSAASFKVTLPSAPADKTEIWVKLNGIGTNKYLTLATSGTDKFNTSTGTVEIYMYLFGEFAQCVYCSATGLWTTFISAGTYNFANNFPGVDASTPISNADISIDTATRVLTIVPPLGYFNIFSDGGGVTTRYRKVGTQTFPAFTDTSGTWYFYYNSAGVAVTTQTPWTIAEFPSIVPVYRLVWNKDLFRFTVTAATAAKGDTYTNNSSTFTVKDAISGGTTLICERTTGTNNPTASGNLVRATGAGTNPIVFSAYSEAVKLQAQYIEYHVNDIPADTHQWFHLQGAQWATGFTMANNALTSGAGNADGRNSVIALTTGANIDDNLEYTVTNNTTGNPFTQDLGNTTPASLNATNSALFKVYTQNALGSVFFNTATRFPFPSVASNYMQFITATGVQTDIANGNFGVVFVYGTQNPVTGEAIKVVSATQEFTSITLARAYNWIDIQNTYTMLNDGEIRPLYRLIFEVRNSYNAAIKHATLRETQDLRKAQVTSTTAATGSIPATSVTTVPSGSILTNAQSSLDNLDLLKAPLASPSFTGTVVLGTSPTMTTPVITGLPTGTGVASAATVSTLMARDANGNSNVVNMNEGYATTVTSASPVVLTVASNNMQYFTGSTAQTVTLPVTSTLVLGQSYWIINNSTAAVTVNSSGGNAVIICAAGTSTEVTCILTSGTTAASWSAQYFGANAATGKKLTISNTLTFTGTDGTSFAFPSTSKTVMASDFTNASGAIPSAVTATTQSANDNSTKIATTAYVDVGLNNSSNILQNQVFN